MKSKIANDGTATLRPERSNAGAWRICWLAMMFVMAFLLPAESGDKRTTRPNTKSAPPIRILDEKGQPAVNGVRSPTGAIFDVTVGGGTGTQFVPDTVNISVGDTVRWTWANSGHSVTSGMPCAADSQFCSPNDTNCPAEVLSNMGTVYQHTFAVPGSYSYFCFSHCALGMTGVVNVSGGCAPSGWSPGPDMPSTCVRAVGVYFQANGKFYSMGGRSMDGAGNDFVHPFEYDPATNAWTTKAASFPDNQVSNMACGVLADAGERKDLDKRENYSCRSSIPKESFSDPKYTVRAWPGVGQNAVLPGGFTIAAAFLTRSRSTSWADSTSPLGMRPN
jgi:plastocyanin